MESRKRMRLFSTSSSSSDSSTTSSSSTSSSTSSTSSSSASSDSSANRPISPSATFPHTEGKAPCLACTSKVDRSEIRTPSPDNEDIINIDEVPELKTPSPTYKKPFEASGKINKVVKSAVVKLKRLIADQPKTKKRHIMPYVMPTNNTEENKERIIAQNESDIDKTENTTEQNNIDQHDEIEQILCPPPPPKIPIDESTYNLFKHQIFIDWEKVLKIKKRFKLRINQHQILRIHKKQDNFLVTIHDKIQVSNLSLLFFFLRGENVKSI